ncbi:hypothetical protein J2I46_11440 [Fibrella sp. HMF5405]|uniref:Uncharacterized protein n=1 Tax=Fibrella forsythiae TaxID=2817061 RepID=A0ABS3JIY6_9BACT|nr:hypothetical protein [Fibrella forsythiae]
MRATSLKKCHSCRTSLQYPT